jgi:hypothetical protein
MEFKKIFKNCCKNTTFFKQILLLSFFLIITNSCSLFKEKEGGDKNIIEKESFEPNVFKRAEQSVEKGGSVIFGGGKQKVSEFGSDNIIWQASLRALGDIPLAQVNYTGGVIITDWYNSNSSSESIKISVFINSARLETSSIEIKSFKKICEVNVNCKTIPLQDSFNNSIKDKILDSARTISLEKKKTN